MGHIASKNKGTTKDPIPYPDDILAPTKQPMWDSFDSYEDESFNLPPPQAPSLGNISSITSSLSVFLLLCVV